VRWDLYCHVIDNHGDHGVGWRLAADLSGRGEQVRLRVDGASALAWMAPAGAPGVELRQWDDPPEAPGDVVIELFGCDPPAACLARMAAEPRPPVWIILEYLSAEAWVERTHRLRSPVGNGPARGLDKWFWFPGFTERTGGLIREPGLFDPATADEPDPTPEPAASVFCYPNPALPALARDWPGVLRLARGAAQDGLPPPAAPHAERLPWLTQAGYDALLRRSALNFVRGEDSLVRAIWAGRPFVWQIYPQHHGVHRAKLDAFLDRFLAAATAAGVGDGFAGRLRGLWHAWNGFAPWPGGPAGPGWPAADDWDRACRHWRARLASRPDLVSGLQAFVADRR
jgi:uncharacterized repeat protein (TIGR03837 family)